MADTVKCSVCGEVNPADNEFCQNCQSRLQPLTGPLRAENAPISPGQAPTKKVTSELEPILPQWLRNARQQARQAADETPAEQEQKTRPAPRPDLLAGLQSQSGDEDEEMPDWLSHITGAPAKKKKVEPENTPVKFVELGDDEMAGPPAKQTSSDDENYIPSWMGQQEAAPEKDEMADWFKQASVSSTDEGASPVQPAFSEPEPPSTFDTNNADWLKNFDADASAFESAASEQTPTPSSSPTLDWLKDFDSGSSAFNETPASEPVETPKTAPLGGPPVQQEVPDWLKSVGAATPAEPPAENLPDWLKAAAPPTEELPAAQPKPARDETSTPSTNLDWLSSIQPSDSKVFDSSQPAAPALKPEEPSSTPALSSSAFTEDSLSNSDVDNIFGSMQMPDWLSAAAPTQTSAEEKLPPASQSEQSIAPAELPSWVQAMRPVESASSSAGPRSSELETRGPLAGLHGVLPSIPGVTGASSKPKAHSIKLDASEEQQAHAELLERILAAETAPIPMKSSAVVASQRALRWTIFGLFLFILGGVLFAGTQIFPLPAEVPAETGNAIALVESIPADAPVLVAFDYEPSTVGEMEATGASLMDHLLLLKHPRLTLISTSPTGSALAERFMSEVLTARAYQRGQQYADLGYLPGGLAGVYDFSQNPSVVMPYGADSSVVWASVPLQNVTHLSDFAALIVLTDKVESGRVWIEQTASARGKAPLILISSAQAGPMFMPYVDSGQVNGMVVGLNGAAGAEQANGGQPASVIRRSWDAYSVGLFQAVIMIALGGVWNFGLGLRDRRAQQEGR